MTQLSATNPLRFAKNDQMLAFVQKTYEEKMTPAKLDAVIRSLKSASDQKFSASGTVAGALFWVSFSLDCEKNSFNHNAWGGATLGGGGCWGDLYTGDLARCFRDTTSFSLTVTPASVLTTFHADDSTLLGTYIGGGYMAPALWFEGGGPGNWAKRSM